MAEEEEKEKKKETKIMVVAQLPQQHIVRGDVDGVETNFITIEDALTEILENTRLIKKAVA